MKRITVASVFGVLAGVVCASAAFSIGLLAFTSVNLIWVLLNRAVMGFAIGASGLRLHWAWNGVLTGLVVGSIFSYFLFMSGSPVWLPPMNLVVNGLFGLAIEFCTTVLCKLPRHDSGAPTGEELAVAEVQIWRGRSFAAMAPKIMSARQRPPA